MLVKDHATGKIVIRPSRDAVRYVDTGKVKIGSAYTPPPRALNWDEERIQTSLLDRKPLFRGWW